VTRKGEGTNLPPLIHGCNGRSILGAAPETFMIDFPTSSAPPLNLAVDPAARAALNGIPAIDFRSNFALAVAAGRGMPGMLRDVVALRFGPGRLTSNEYY
jgi:hypothetical protein